MTEHPITPPPELVQQWYTEADNQLSPYYVYVATQAARWAADQELEACCEFEATAYSTDCADKLRRHRRPKPPSLKAQALDALHLIRDHLPADMYEKSFLIRRALEALPD